MKYKSVLTSLNRMPRVFKRFIVLLIDFLLSGLTFWYSIYLLTGQWQLQGAEKNLSMIFTGIVSGFIFYYYGLYYEVFRYVGSAAFKSIVRAFTTLFILEFAIFTIIGVSEVPRSIGIIQPIFLFCAVGFLRYFIRFVFGALKLEKSGRKINILIFGAGHSGRQLLATLNTDKAVNVKGFIDDDRQLQGNYVNGIRVYSSERLQELINSLGITDVLLAIPSASRDRRLEIIDSIRDARVRVRTLPNIVNLAAGQIRLTDLDDLDMNDFLGRKEVPPNPSLLSKTVTNKVVVVSGAGGSIGSELSRQIFALSPKELILVDISEFNLYSISSAFKELSDQRILAGNQEKIEGSPESHNIDTKINSYLLSVRDRESLQKIFFEHRPDTVFHAAAYKHVPLVEENMVEGIRNNVFGTKCIAELSMASGVHNFMLVSTDKAVRPTNIMGVSKRISEIILQSLAEQAREKKHATIFSMVRFGNVLGSSGSVAPLFIRQIKERKSITLTHPDVTRYFMSIPEAAQLVLQATSMATGGEVFILDMGAPVRIYDLALRLIHLSGLAVKNELHPDGDIEIKIIGLRQGEKLFEELLIGNNPEFTEHKKILKANESFISWDQLEKELESLEEVLTSDDKELICTKLRKLVPEYRPS